MAQESLAIEINGADFNCRSKTAIRKNNYCVLFFAKENICITCSLHQTPNSETTNPDSSKLAFFVKKSGADFNSRRKTAVRRKENLFCFCQREHFITCSLDQTPNPETTNHELFFHESEFVYVYSNQSKLFFGKKWCRLKIGIKKAVFS